MQYETFIPLFDEPIEINRSVCSQIYRSVDPPSSDLNSSTTQGKKQTWRESSLRLFELPSKN